MYKPERGRILGDTFKYNEFQNNITTFFKITIELKLGQIREKVHFLQALL